MSTPGTYTALLSTLELSHIRDEQARHAICVLLSLVEARQPTERVKRGKALVFYFACQMSEPKIVEFFQQVGCRSPTGPSPSS